MVRHGGGLGVPWVFGSAVCTLCGGYGRPAQTKRRKNAAPLGQEIGRHPGKTGDFPAGSIHGGGIQQPIENKCTAKPNQSTFFVQHIGMYPQRGNLAGLREHCTDVSRVGVVFSLQHQPQGKYCYPAGRAVQHQELLFYPAIPIRGSFLFGYSGRGRRRRVAGLPFAQDDVAAHRGKLRFSRVGTQSRAGTRHDSHQRHKGYDENHCPPTCWTRCAPP